ncbi:MerR family transcriptional regulator [Longimycelium tulufanense]|uniref:MerR family transcriptional regulator n=1 Tax=Longimycelium tulufanense TaxID=907463 RepID=A0A8J3CCS8_9PSEU|nr:helix-turn-helix domain-containing protein [Longimycelium tulufanense]GGM48635.1 MerR family transcriptional regulator [Longimycelium tulufanense]
MMQQWYSVEQVADLLGLHVKTVRGYVRDGRLAAVRVGKQYRISREDLAEFTGGQPEPVARTRHVEVSSFVQIDAISRESMTRLTTMVMGSLRGEPDGEPLRVQTIYDEERASLKVIVIGGTTRTAELLRLIDAIVGQV